MWRCLGDGHAELLTELAPILGGKVVVDCVNPLGFDKQGAYALGVEDGTAGWRPEIMRTESALRGTPKRVAGR